MATIDAPVLDEERQSDAAPSRSEELRAFYGPRGDPYVKYHTRLDASKNGYVASFAWRALLLGPVWFFRRKLYIAGTLVLLLPLLFILSFRSLDHVSIIYVALAVQGNSIYASKARRCIARADLRGLTGKARLDYLRRAGGVSVIGMAYGLAVLSAIAIVIVHQMAGS